MAERYAIYYAPPVTSPLWERASVWLGRDAASGDEFDGPVAGIDRDRLLNITAAPNRYGFHATLRAPFHLADGLTEADIAKLCEAFAAGQAPIATGGLVLGLLDGFLALLPADQPQPLTDLAQAVVEASDVLRAPLSGKERERRLKTPLSPRQVELLDRHGYPYVAEEFRFHMTLADRLDPAVAPEILRAAETWFGPVLADGATLDRLVVFVEPGVDRAFRRLADFPFRGGL